MAVDWSLATPQYDYLDTLRAIGAAQDQRLKQQQIQSNAAQQQRSLAARQQASQQLSTGDYSGAQQTAIQSGDNDLFNSIKGLAADHQKQLGDEATAIASTAYQLKQIPPEQRAAAFQAMVPALKQRFGDHELQNVDLSDQGLDGYINLGQTVQQHIENARNAQKDQLEANKVTWVTPQPGTTAFAVDAMGNPIATQPGVGQPAGAPPVAAPGGTFGAMLGAESGNRQFGPNGQVVTSPKGAIGAAQIMPATGPEAAAAAGVAWDPVRFQNDPAYNRQLGEAYYAKQLAAFGGDPTAAAAAYNAGPGRVARSGAPQTQGDWTQSLPAETQAYIRKVAPGLVGGQPATQAGGYTVGRGFIQAPAKPDEANKPPAGYRANPDGTLSFIPGGPADPNGPGHTKTNLTEGQAKATSYYARANLALQQLGAVGNAPPPGAGAQFADELPLGIGQHFISDNDQQQLNARRAFIAAVLRQESGAAISQGEFNSYNKLYFDQTGDSPQVRANKAALRQSAVDSLRLEAGPGAQQLANQSGSPTAPRPARRQQQGPIRITNAAQYNSLPRGASYIDPNGQLRTKR